VLQSTQLVAVDDAGLDEDTFDVVVAYRCSEDNAKINV